MRVRTPLLALLVTAALAAGGPAFAGPPTDQLKGYTDQILKILDDPALKAENRRHERRAAVRKVATEAFDVEETAKRALGRHWQGRSPEERREFVDLFADLLERTYITRIDQYGGEHVKFSGESIEGDRAVVRGKVVTKRGTEVPVEARMHLRHGKWLMYDILLENISLVGNYRAQFDQIIRTASYGELVRRLRDKRFDAPGAQKAS
jgi:phospholipid transport system substrate-binding protein